MTIDRLDTIKSFIGYHVTGFILWSWRTTYCSQTTDGVYIAVDPDEGLPVSIPPLPPKPLITGKGLSFPTVIGDSWQFDTYVIRTKNLNQSISVPAGIFSCVEYEILDSSSVVGAIWSSPNMGIVKATLKVGSQTQVNELNSYKLQ